MASDRPLLERIAGAAARIDPGLSDRDIDRLVEAARRKRRRRVVGRVGLAVLVVGAGALVGLRATSPGFVSQPVAALSPVKPGPMPLRLRDGSIATPLDAGSALTVREDSPGRVALALDRGHARFEVAPRSERPFVVQVGEVTVSVVGTIFAVERVADRIGVSVERGTVRVDWQVGSQVLRAGESGWFPPVQIRAPVAESPTERLTAGARPTAEDATPGVPQAFERVATPLQVQARGGGRAPLDQPQRGRFGTLSGFRPEQGGGRAPLDQPQRGRLGSLAEFRAEQLQPGQNLPEQRDGDFRPGLLEPPAVSHARAWLPNLAARDGGRGVAAPVPPAKDRLPGVSDPRHGVAVPAPSAEELLAAADLARSAGRRGESVALLRRLLHERPEDARAPLAAFTLGRILLMEMGQPGEAALAFAQARALAPAGPFAEDALAREAEAWNKAGDVGKAAARAREYLRLYPHGRRAEFLQGLVGIE